MFKHVLCPIDGSDRSSQALDMAAKFAASHGADLTICTVVDPSRAAAMAFGDPTMSNACFDALEDDGNALLTEAASRVQNTVVAHTALIVGQPVDAIVQYAAEHGNDIIIMGSHGRSGIHRALLGSVTEGVVRHAHVPVLIDRTIKNTRTEPKAQL
jgi:nucleotide-binding universal stress UspA family protein